MMLLVLLWACQSVISHCDMDRTDLLYMHQQGCHYEVTDIINGITKDNYPRYRDDLFVLLDHDYLDPHCQLFGQVVLDRMQDCEGLIQYAHAVCDLSHGRPDTFCRGWPINGRDEMRACMGYRAWKRHCQAPIRPLCDHLSNYDLINQ